MNRNVGQRCATSMVVIANILKQKGNNMTLEDYAKEYVKTVMSQPNGWGQCIHTTLGRSDEIMIRMYRLFGGVPSEYAIEAEFKLIRKEV